MKKIIITGGSGFIGRHIVEKLLQEQNSICNLDIARPDDKHHLPFWINCDIRNLEALRSEIGSFQPEIVIHLAAETETNLPNLADYSTNIEGTKNLLEVCKSTPSLQRIVITSTQHVRKPGSDQAKNDEDYNPYKNYGASKVITEQLTRASHLSCTWTIIRPTTIWGPFHEGLSKGLWKVMQKGLYIHPKNDPVIRSYGYVENVVYQILQLVQIDSDTVNKQTFYVGDDNVQQFTWVNEFSKQLCGHNVRQIPRQVIFLLALAGKIFKGLHINFPMDISRYKNLTTNNPVPISKTLDLVGKGPYSLSEGVNKTVQWLHETQSA